MITKFKFYNKEIKISDITVGQYVKLIEGDNNILIEIFGKEGILMNKRQLDNALKILLGGYEANELKELFKKQKIPKGETIELEHFFIIEGIVMKGLGQTRSEIRSWEYLYFMKIYNALDVIGGGKKYEEYKNHNKPDKKAFKKLEKDLLNNK